MAYLGSFNPKIHGINYDNLTTAKRNIIYPANKYTDINGKKALYTPSSLTQKRISGSVFEKSVAVQRRLLVIAEDGLVQNGYPFILDTVTSDPATGAFTAKIGTYPGKVTLLCLDATFSTTLLGSINASQTTMQIANKSPLNLNNIMLTIDNEVVQVVSGGDTTTLTIVRGKKGSTPAAHSTGATVSKIDLNAKVYSKLTGY